MDRQFLIIDADDTLWENNIYFERAFDEFVDFLAHSSLTPQQVRDVLDEIEAANTKIHGYGSLNFGRNLRQCYEHLAERDISRGRPEDGDRLRRADPGMPDGSDRGRPGDAGVPRGAPRSDAVHQGPSRRSRSSRSTAPASASGSRTRRS